MGTSTLFHYGEGLQLVKIMAMFDFLAMFDCWKTRKFRMIHDDPLGARGGRKAPTLCVFWKLDHWIPFGMILAGTTNHLRLPSSLHLDSSFTCGGCAGPVVCIVPSGELRIALQQHLQMVLETSFSKANNKPSPTFIKFP